MKSFRIIFFLIFICVFKNYGVAYFCEEIRLAIKEGVKFGKEVRDLQGLKLVGTGEGGVPELKNLTLSFASEEKLTIEEVRRIYVSLMERLVKRINAVKEVRPFLKQYPLTAHNFNVGIMYVRYEDRKKLFVLTPYVSLVKLINGKIYYEMSPDGVKLIDLWEEPYEEALRIVNGEAVAKIMNRLNDEF